MVFMMDFFETKRLRVKETKRSLPQPLPKGKGFDAERFV